MLKRLKKFEKKCRECEDSLVQALADHVALVADYFELEGDQRAELAQCLSGLDLAPATQVREKLAAARDAEKSAAAPVAQAADAKDGTKAKHQKPKHKQKKHDRTPASDAEVADVASNSSPAPADSKASDRKAKKSAKQGKSGTKKRHS